MADDFYAVLGVQEDAAQPEIKQAYRALARKYHPDKNPGDAEAESKFKDAAEAYRVLGDADLRAEYDAHRRGGGSKESAEDVLDDLFGTRKVQNRRPEPPSRTPPRARSEAGRGSDFRYRLEISFEEAALGTEAQISVPGVARCRVCLGTGSRPGSAVRICEDCHGSGTVRVQQGFFDRSERCGNCQGSGRRSPRDCPGCRGAGTESIERTLAVPIPPGLEHGARLRLAGEGQATNGGPPGDLYVVVEIRPDPLFTREGLDVVTEIPVTFVEAALGAQIEIPTLEGKVRMRIPPGSQTGRVFRLKGKGLPGKGGERGDQRVRIHVDVPATLTDAQRELLERFAEVDEVPGAQARVDDHRRNLHERYG
ncbi:MAG: molecular chaperone DnaJ [Deltaproteobacteria bacterium]|jgi:molecular chaperone DnaJ|nr:molecular chaperone DnaJ [Deltaproteobacteria bacterium]